MLEIFLTALARAQINTIGHHLIRERTSGLLPDHMGDRLRREMGFVRTLCRQCGPTDTVDCGEEKAEHEAAVVVAP